MKRGYVNILRNLLQNCAWSRQARQMSSNPDTPGPSGPNFKLYELRIYKMNPQYYKESIELMGKYWHVRMRYSKLIGSWMTEIGALCETVHLWEYRNLSDRFIKREALCGDRVWQNEYLPKLAKQALYLSSQLLMISPGSRLVTDFGDDLQGSYELHSCEPYTPIILDAEEEMVVGQFTCLYGPTPAEYILIRYTDHDKALEKAYRRRKSQVLRGYSRYMIACPWSPLQ